MTWQVVLDAILLGLLNGCIYALIAIGVALIFGVVGVVNFAHAEMLMLAAYIMVFFVNYLSGNPYLGILIAVALVAGFGFLFDSLVLRRVRRTYGHSMRDRELASLVGTMGISFLLANAVFIFVGPDYYRVPRLIAGSTRAFVIGIPNQLILAAVVSVVIIFALFAFLKFSRVGRAIRAVKDQPDVVEAFGVNRERMFAISFGIATGMAAIAGALIAPIQYIYPYMGSEYVIKAFIITILAGLGSINGVLAAAILLALLESIGTTYISSHAGTMVFFLTMVVCLIVRPYGLFGRAEVLK